MKLIRIIAHSFDLDRVVAALDGEGFHGLSIAEVVYCDTDRKGREGASLRNEIEVALHDDRVSRALQALQRAACKRDLLMTIEELEHAVRIRTGEQDEAAIWQ